MTGPQTPGELSRRAFVAAGALATSGAALVACSAPRTPDSAPSSSRPSASPRGTNSPSALMDSWAPAPIAVGQLHTVAVQEAESLVLLTRSGRRKFWAGVTLDSAMPGRAPERMSITAAEYRRWLPMMADLGIHVIRCRTIHPPHFYTELFRYNTEHRDAPLYLVQGAQPVQPWTGDLFARSTSSTATQLITDASAAVHGKLRRAAARGRVGGVWKADVSPWVAAWIIGSPLEPATVKATNEGSSRTHNAGSGTYFSPTAKATATERWLAQRLDELAALEAAHGLSVPVGVENSPATDPLSRPDEPLDREGLVGVDMNHIATSTTWPGGAFIACAAPPYAPSLLRQPSHDSQPAGDPYAAYLRDLARHHTGRPLLVTDAGVPSSIGGARHAPRDRDLGNKSEHEAMAINAELVRLYASLGLAGGMLASWTDDWSAQSWNTAVRYEPSPDSSAPIWHDPLTADQWFGLVAHDPVRAGARTIYEGATEMQRIDVDHDASFLYLTFFFSRRVTSPVDIGFDILPGYGLVLPGGSGKNVYDVAIQVIPTMSTATCLIRSAIDPVRLDGLPSEALPRPGSRGWNEQRLTLAQPTKASSTGRELPAQLQEVGTLSLGSWDVKDPTYNSRATWSLDRTDAEQPARLSFRLPWSLLALADPAAKIGLVPRGGEPTGVPVSVIEGLIESSTPGSPTSFTVKWDSWDSVTFSERLKAGVDVLATAMEETARAATAAPTTAPAGSNLRSSSS